MHTGDGYYPSLVGILCVGNEAGGVLKESAEIRGKGCRIEGKMTLYRGKDNAVHERRRPIYKEIVPYIREDKTFL